ncbi:MAG TPA: calcium/sodium antiporter [Thermoanaerobaculia bacterium]|nr:calcium/sodium antiporter [Thermoanaerobaculia bacterium]
MSPTLILLFLAGLVLLLGGAELLVRGASRLAVGLGISPLVVGLTVVAFGTSSPELAVSVRAALTGDGAADIAVGNVVGSNIANVLLILGLSAVIAPLAVSRQLVRLDVPIMVGSSLLLVWMARDGSLGRLEGALLFAGVVAYTAFAIVQSRRETAERGHLDPDPDELRGRRLAIDALLVVAGLALLVVGARWLVDGAVTLATLLGVSELIIGLTVVAVGTSLPELATSALAAWRGQRDIAVGNVVGSNTFNILSVLGASALVAPAGLAVSPQARAFDLPVMLAVAVLCVPIFFTGFRIARLEGALFLLFYGAYVAYLALHATGHPSLASLRWAVLWVAIPMTVLALALASVRQWSDGRRAASNADVP